MKFEYDELVIYKDNGTFPSLNGMQCRVIGANKRMGYRLIEVEFILYNGSKFIYEFEPKKLKKIKKGKRRFLWFLG